MQLIKVTITGVDEYTPLYALEQLTERYPFVEWGILMSLSRAGEEKRYPSLPFLYEIGKAKIPTSVHLCGALARLAFQDRLYPIHMAKTIIPHANRIQINLGKQLATYDHLKESIFAQAQERDVQIIIQTPSFTLPLVEPEDHYENKPWTILDENEANVVYLQDASGGTGKQGPFEVPHQRNFVGYAGGIDPSNVQSKVAEIQAFDCDSPFWIDMETGVRDWNDKLDLNKVELVLRRVEPLIDFDYIKSLSSNLA